MVLVMFTKVFMSSFRTPEMFVVLLTYRQPERQKRDAEDALRIINLRQCRAGSATVDMCVERLRREPNIVGPEDHLGVS